MIYDEESHKHIDATLAVMTGRPVSALTLRARLLNSYDLDVCEPAMVWRVAMLLSEAGRCERDRVNQMFWRTALLLALALGLGLLKPFDQHIDLIETDADQLVILVVHPIRLANGHGVIVVRSDGEGFGGALHGRPGCQQGGEGKWVGSTPETGA